MLRLHRQDRTAQGAMADRLEDLEVFIQTARLGSLTAAARALAISTTAASRRLSTLEERLGVRLIERTTRQLHLTAAGQLYLHEGAAVLAALDAVEGALQADPAAGRPLRLAAPAGLLDPLLFPILHDHPDLALDLCPPDAPDADLTVLIGPPSAAPPGTVQQILGPCRWTLCAAPVWRDTRPADAGVAALGAAGIRIHGLPTMWSLQPGGGAEVQTVVLAGRLTVPDLAAARAAAQAGLGCTILPAQLVGAALVPLLPGGAVVSEDVLLARCTLRALRSPAARTLLDALAGVLQ